MVTKALPACQFDGTTAVTGSSVSEHLATTAAQSSGRSPDRSDLDNGQLDPHRMRRVVIVGSYGAGKTTLAAALGPVLDLEVHHLDALRWQPGWRLRPLSEWHTILGEIVACDTWIIEGNFEQTLEPRLQRADAVILLDFPMWLSLGRLVRRRLRGGNRPDLPPGLRERLNFRTLTLVWDYRRRTRQQILGRVDRSRPGRQVVVLRRPSEVSALIADLRRGVELSRSVRD
jgi:adenylate kinase family enzyme